MRGLSVSYGVYVLDTLHRWRRRTGYAVEQRCAFHVSLELAPTFMYVQFHDLLSCPRCIIS